MPDINLVYVTGLIAFGLVIPACTYMIYYELQEYDIYPIKLMKDYFSKT